MASKTSKEFDADMKQKNEGLTVAPPPANGNGKSAAANGNGNGNGHKKNGHLTAAQYRSLTLQGLENGGIQFDLTKTRNGPGSVAWKNDYITDVLKVDSTLAKGLAKHVVLTRGFRKESGITGFKGPVVGIVVEEILRRLRVEGAEE